MILKKVRLEYCLRIKKKKIDIRNYQFEDIITYIIILINDKIT